jgi:hypothetical protein
MPPANLRFGGGAADSAITPVVALCLLVAMVLIAVLPRGKTIAPFLFAFFTIPVGNVVVLGGFHFTALRVLILAGLARSWTFPHSPSGSKYPAGFSALDWAVVIWSVSAVIGLYLEFPQMQALINGLGILLDTLGGYLVVRSFIRDGEAVRRTIKTLAAICTVLGICMINEQISHINVFGMLGGISREVTVRNGELRSSGSMGCLHAGAFSGALIPLFVWLWKEKESRMAAVFGLFGAIAMVITSNSSTSQLALVGSLVGLGFWPLRKEMRRIRWGLVCTLVGLHLYMKAPVWALIGRIDLTGSSSGYQRYMLVDMTIRHFSNWWLIGSQDYAKWGWDSWDLCNQFVAVGLTGGLLPLIFYISIFSRSFGAIGDARKRVNGDRRREWMLWCFGSTLFATVVAHFGINYVAQLLMSFFTLVACIAVLTFEAKQSMARITIEVDYTEMAEPALAS